MQRCLMLGAGTARARRRIAAPNSCPEEEVEWVRLDINPSTCPDILFDLNRMEQGERIPVPDESFDEIHAYEVMEHYGHQGDYQGFFTGMRELWRILKPGGLLLGTSPTWNSRWAFGDPGHVRTIQEEQFFYLEKSSYAHLGVTSMTDYSELVSPCWWVIEQATTNGSLIFCLRKA